MSRLFYQPDPGVSGDFIPWYEDGDYYLFYLRDFRRHEVFGTGMSWYLVTTSDFVSFREHGMVLPAGSSDEQDLAVFTGSVSRYGGKYHIWYTGHNPHFVQAGRPQEVILHAVSENLLNWRKCPEDRLPAPAGRYEPHDWRDPFVYFDEKCGVYRMLLAARAADGAERYRGETAQCISPDGERWEITAPFYAPGRFYTHECPDYFRMGDWEYLVFSEYSQEKVTRYVMRRSPDEPWSIPADDRFDGSAWYAAKSASDGKTRTLFGWLATKQDEKDEGEWQWGGCLVPHEMIQRADGTLGARIPETVKNRIAPARPGRQVSLDAAAGMEVCSFGVTGDTCRLSLRFRMQAPVGMVSLAIRANEDLDEGWYLRLDFNRRRISVDRWPRSAYVSFQPGLERLLPASPADGIWSIEVLMEGSSAVACINDEITLSWRMYSRGGSCWGILAEGASVRILC